MDSQKDRNAKHLERIKAQLADLDREDAERAAAAADPGSAVVDRRKGGTLRSAAFLISILLLAAGLFGLSVTSFRLRGHDIADAERLGQATVTSCTRRGPITNQGFGYWDSCAARVSWAGGDVEEGEYGAVFTSADVGTQVRVGDLGRHRAKRELVSADAPYRPWFAWIGYFLLAIGAVPGLIGVLILQALVKYRRR
jgi:hypothetical protein